MKKIRELFRNTKLNIKFTSIIILFMVIPIGVLAGVLFYVMEQNAVQENMDYMEYTMQRNEDGIKTKIDSINMSTQFFLSDDSLLQMLNASAIGGEISTADWLDFKNNEVSALERLVNNNPLLYGVRVYAVNDSVQEMMPILYNASRMKKQEWSKQDKYVGWNFDYTDNIFNSYTMNQNRKIISLVTPIIDSANGKVGVIESAMTMENMFPSLYEGIEDEWSFFYSDEGVTYFGQKEQTESSALLDDILKQRPTEDKIQTIYKKLDGKKLVISYMQVRKLSGTLICVKDITKNVHNVYFMRDVFVAVMLAFIILLAFFINRIVQHLLKQFYEILKSIRKVQKGDLDVAIENCGKDEMGELGTQINKMLERIKELMEDNLNREMLAKNSEIRALQNQINPHFLYNTLESIRSEALIAGLVSVADMTEALATFFRYTISKVENLVSVEEELQNCMTYFKIQQYRFGDRLQLSVECDPEEKAAIYSCRIPKLTLQPILENSIIHGTECKLGTGHIRILLEMTESCLLLCISDDGNGMEERKVADINERLQKSGGILATGESETKGGIALVNVNNRIHLLFGEEYGIHVYSMPEIGTDVKIRIPVIYSDRNLIHMEERQENYC